VRQQQEALQISSGSVVAACANAFSQRRIPRQEAKGGETAVADFARRGAAVGGHSYESFCDPEAQATALLAKIE